jgi:ribosomal protein L2
LNGFAEKGVIVSQGRRGVKQTTACNKRGKQKKTQLRGVALNPPKEEEGGGDKLQHAIENHLSMLKLERTIHHAFAAAQDSFAAPMPNISLSSSK